MSDPGSTTPRAEESERSSQEGSATKNEQDEMPNEEIAQSTPVVPNSFALLQTLLGSMPRPTVEGINENPPDPSTIFPPRASPEDMLSSLISVFGKLKEAQMQIPEIGKAEIPTASLPPFMFGADRPKTNGPTYRPAESDSMESLLGMVSQAFSILDKIKDGVANPNNPPAGAAPPSTSHPLSRTPFGTMMEAISAPLAVPRNKSGAIGQPPTLPPQFDSRTAMLNGVTRAYQTNEMILRTSIQTISRQLESTPEDSSNYPLLQSVLGLSLLHLYEVTWDDDLLDAGLGGTTLALGKLLRLPRFGMGRSAPTVVRSWAYGQRLLVQRDGDVDKLQATVSILKSCWEIYKDFEALEARVKMFLRTELGMCLLDQYRSTGSLDDLNSSIEHLQALFEEDDGAAPVTVALGSAYHDRFLHCGDIDDLDRALNQGQRACAIGINAPLSISSVSVSAASYDTDAAAGHHLFALGLSERFKMTLDVEDLDKAVRQCKKAIGNLHPSHTLLPPYKASLVCILHARYEATKEVEDLRSAMQVIQSAVEGSKGTTGRHLRVPLETIQGYLTVMNSGADIGNISVVEDGIRMITKSRKDFSGAAHIESHIESYLSKSFLYLFRITNNWDDFESGLHHAILAFEKAPEESPYRHQAGLDMGKLMLEQYQTGHSTDFDEALAQFCTIALSSTWPSIRLDAAIQWANVIEKTDPEAALDALTTALEVLPSLASLGERMSTQYRILSHQKSTIPQRAAIYALDAGDMAMAVSCLEKGRNIMWAQSLQLRAGHMLPAGNERQHEFKVLAQHLLSQRQGLPRSPEAFEGMIRHFPPDHMNRVAPILGLIRPLMSSYSEIKEQLVRIGGAERVEKDLSLQQEFRENFMEVYRNASLHGSAKRWNTLLEEFNELQGALSFDSNTQKDLVPILKSGSIVVVNTYKARCEGVVISTYGEKLDFQCISFPDLSEDRVYTWANSLRDGMNGLVGGEITISKYENDFLVPVLRGLWKGLGIPLLAHFTQSGTSDPKRRIWWYPTGPLMFLPIHAASPCDGDEPGLLEHLISSYIPSIHSLVRASRAPTLPFKVLAVGQPETPGHSPLTYADKEIGALKRQLRDSPDRITTLIGEEAKIYPVISSISEYTALQISCHATQNEQYPFDSAFYLYDGPLKLSKIMGIDLSRVQFAFLSACLTSAGDAGLPDECIHLAAGMQFAGVGSVIGTMWSVEDRISAAMSTQVYKYLLRNGVVQVDMKESAEALHKAIQVVRKSGIPLTYIVPFIHSGI